MQEAGTVVARIGIEGRVNPRKDRASQEFEREGRHESSVIASPLGSSDVIRVGLVPVASPAPLAGR
jgi:hypothetical protein